MVETLAKIAERFDDLVEEAKKDSSFLTRPALEIFRENQEKYKTTKYTVVQGTGELYAVQWKEQGVTKRVTVAMDGTRSCTCQMWTQQGVLCPHAMAAAKKKGVPFSDLFKPAFFHRHMLNATRKEMIAKCNLRITIPSDYHIYQQMASGPSPGATYKPLLPFTIRLEPLEDRVATSKKRIRSTGESKKSSNVHAKRGKRFLCPSCYQTFSCKTKHKRGSVQCEAYLNAHPEIDLWREVIRGDDDSEEGEQEQEQEEQEQYLEEEEELEQEQSSEEEEEKQYLEEEQEQEQSSEEEEDSEE